MKISRKDKIDYCKIYSLEKYSDNRGYIVETFDSAIFKKLLEKDIQVFSGHETYSRRDVLRGLHYQVGEPQSRLVRVNYGLIFEVVLDLRKSSPSFGKWFDVILSSENFSAIWVPAGVAHGYFVLSEFAIVNIYADRGWSEADQRCIKWNDGELAIDWPLYKEYPVIIPPILSERDKNGQNFLNAEYC